MQRPLPQEASPTIENRLGTTPPGKTFGSNRRSLIFLEKISFTIHFELKISNKFLVFKFPALATTEEKDRHRGGNTTSPLLGDYEQQFMKINQRNLI